MSTAAPAQAYGSELSSSASTVSTNNCPCVLYDDIDNTYLQYDQGGVAIKIVLKVGSRTVAKVEFHPYGEHLWVYDTANDGDSVYVVVGEKRGDTWYSSGPYTAGGNPGDVVQYTDYNLSFDDGNPIVIAIWDNAALTDWITGAGDGRA